jgi:hypothetical protein
MHVGDKLGQYFIIFSDLDHVYIHLKYKCHGGSHDNDYLYCNPSINDD